MSKPTVTPLQNDKTWKPSEKPSDRDSAVAQVLMETSVTELELRIPPSTFDASLVFIYPRGVGMGTRYKLADKAIVIGRDEGCDVRIEDISVSRCHARIQLGMEGHYVEDLQSTNGTSVNDTPILRQRLRDGDYLRLGNCIFRFLAGNNLETAYHEEIYRLTIMDALTGTYNKRYLLEFLDRELSRSARYDRPLSLVLLDIDHFKKINDEYGHLAGDFTLRELAAQVRPVIRTEELFARYGGEEFALVLPETEHADAMQLAERLRTLIEEFRFEFNNASLHVTVSLGVASTPGGRDWTAQQLLLQADRKLYEAKHAGRNRVIG